MTFLYTGGPLSPDSAAGSEGRFTRRHTTRISIRDRFKKNLRKVIDEANTGEEQPDEHNDEEIYSMEPPPLPRRGKLANRVNRYAEKTTTAYV